MQPPTDFIRKMKGIAQNREGDMMLFEQRKQLPEVRVQNRVAAGEIKIRCAVIDLTEIKTVVKRILHLIPGHGIEMFAVVFRENITVLAPLVTVIGDVPLERKIRIHM